MLVAAFDVFPARVVRQLLLNFLCIQPVEDHPSWTAIREFIRSRDAALPKEAPSVELYFNASQTYRLAPVCVIRVARDGHRLVGRI